MREFLCSSEEGPMTVKIREKMTQEEYEEIEGWFALILRQAKRRIAVNEETPTSVLPS